LIRIDIGGPGLYGGPVIGFRLTREADDLTPRTVDGKATIDCVYRKIMIWVMSDTP
jgi:hypothetical protein